MAESFFSLLKKEWIKRRIYPSRATAASDVFDYIEMFYNFKPRLWRSHKLRTAANVRARI